MSKVMNHDDKLRGDFKRYLVKIACNKSDALLTEADVLKAFDLSIQKQKLTSLEAAMLTPPELKKSNFDISGATDLVKGTCIHELVEALNSLASWDEGEVVDNSFDEPSAAFQAREVLTKWGFKTKE